MSQLQQIRIGHSPDSDDAFMFYALANGLIPTDGFEIVQVAEDIESLNQRAVNGGIRGDSHISPRLRLRCQPLCADALWGKHWRSIWPARRIQSTDAAGSPCG